MNTLADLEFGVQIQQNSYLPEFRQKILLNPCGCGDDVTAKFNDWLLMMFGVERVVYKVGSVVMMHPNTYREFKEQMRNGNS